MKFDMFQAMRIAAEKFGRGKVEISLRELNQAYHIRLWYYDGLTSYSTEFSIDFSDILDSNILMMQLRFNRALLELERGIPR